MEKKNNTDLSRYSSQKLVQKKLKKLEKQLFNRNHQWNNIPLTVSQKEIDEIESLEQAVTIYGRLHYISRQQKTGPSKLLKYSALGFFTAYTLGVVWVTSYINPSQYLNTIDTKPYTEFITKSTELIIPKKTKEELLIEQAQKVIKESDVYYQKFKQQEEEEKEIANQVRMIPSRLHQADDDFKNHHYDKALKDLKHLLHDITIYSQQDKELNLDNYITLTKTSILNKLKDINTEMRHNGTSVDKVHANYLEQQKYASPDAQLNVYVSMYDYYIKNLTTSEANKNTALYERSLYYLNKTASMIKNNQNYELQQLYSKFSQTLAEKPKTLPNHSSISQPPLPPQKEEKFDIDIKEPEAINMDDVDWDSDDF